MKVALCLAGYIGFAKRFNVQSKLSKNESEPLPLDIGYESIKKHFMKDYDVDTYVHSWSVDREKDILDLYKPKKYIIEKQRGEDDGILDNRYSQWYSRSKSLSLAFESGIEYDWLMVTRFDLIFNTPFLLENLNNKNVYLAGDRRPTEVNDVYFLSGIKNMKHISNFYSKLPESGYAINSTRGNLKGGIHWATGVYIRQDLGLGSGSIQYIGSDTNGTIKFVRDSLEEYTHVRKINDGEN